MAAATLQRQVLQPRHPPPYHLQRRAPELEALVGCVPFLPRPLFQTYQPKTSYLRPIQTFPCFYDLRTQRQGDSKSEIPILYPEYIVTDLVEQELNTRSRQSRFLRGGADPEKLFKRATDPQTVRCTKAPAAPDLNYILPDYPSTPDSSSANPNGGAAAIAAISKRWDMEEYRTAQGPCSYRFTQFNGRVAGHEYASEFPIPLRGQKLPAC